MKAERAQAWAVGTAASLFFLSFHSFLYNLDGVACAIAVDLTRWRNLTHGNHLLYGVAALAFSRLFSLFGYRGPSLPLLQAFDSLLGGATVGLFWRLLEKIGVRRSARAACCAGLALSQTYWLWSLEAQVYMLGAFFLALAAQEAFSPRPRPSRLGFWMGLACLGHVGHVMFWPVAALGLSRAKAGRREWLSCAAIWLAVLALAYAAAAGFCVKPASLAQARVWLLGSAALKNDHSFTWYGGWSLTDLRLWALMSARIFADGMPLSGAAARAGWLLGSAGLALALIGAWTSVDRASAKMALVWIASYAVLFSSWQPYTAVYRATDLLALWLLAALALQRWGRPAVAAAAGLVLALGLFNWSGAIGPACDPALNKPYEDALWLEGATPENAWIVATGTMQVYASYFGHRRPLNMRFFEGQESLLDARLDELAAAGEPVFITSRVLATTDTDAFARYGLAETARRGELVLYRVMKGKPSGSRTKKLKMAAALRNGPNGIGSERLSAPRAISVKP